MRTWEIISLYLLKCATCTLELDFNLRHSVYVWKETGLYCFGALELNQLMWIMHQPQPYSITVHCYTLHDWTQTQWTSKFLQTLPREIHSKALFQIQCHFITKDERWNRQTGEADGKHALVGDGGIWQTLIWTMWSQRSGRGWAGPVLHE